MKSFSRAFAAMLVAAMVFTSPCIAVEAPASEAPTTIDFLKEMAVIAAAQSAGKKDDAFQLNQALYEKLSTQLELAHLRLGDLTLRRINPFITPQARQAAVAAYAPARDAARELITTYGAFAQTQPAFLESVGQPVSDSVQGVGKAYHALLGIRTMLTAAMLMDANLKGPDGKPLNAHQNFARGIEAAARTTPANAGGAAKDFFSTAKAKLPATADISARVSKNFLSFVPAYLSITQDNLSAEDMLTSLIAIDSTNAALWAERSKVRLGLGEIEGAYYDAVIALAIGGETPATLSAHDQFAATPRYPSAIFQEPVSSLFQAQAAVTGLLGGKLSPDAARSVRAAQRNRDRRLYACSFIDEPGARAAAIKWVLENNKEDAALRGEVLGDKADQFEADYKAARTAKKEAAVFAAYDDYATYLAWHHSFWQRRARDLYKINKKPAALAAIDVAVAVAPDDQDVAKMRDLIASSVKSQTP